MAQSWIGLDLWQRFGRLDDAENVNSYKKEEVSAEG